MSTAGGPAPRFALPPRPHPGGERGPLRPAAGVRVEHLVGPAPLWGSNGVAIGPDGRLWIAEFLGGTVSALDLATGERETVLGPDGPLVAPDDIAFDHATGALYIVDLPPGLVWRRDPDATMTVVADGITAPDGITVHAGRLFVNELHPAGRLLEVDLAGGPPRVMDTGLVLGNAMVVAGDGRLYYPHLAGGEVWRVELDGGTPERVLADLPWPVAVRLAAAGRLLVLSFAAPRLDSYDLDGTHRRTLETGVDGADNLAVGPDGTCYVSSARHGGILALRPDGAREPIVATGLLGPFGVTSAPDLGVVVADHHGIVSVADDGTLVPHGVMGATVPSAVRGIAAAGGELHVTTEGGEVHSGDPTTGMRRRVEGLVAPQGIAAGPDGLLVAESGRGRVLRIGDATGGDEVHVVAADGLAQPVDVAVDDAGTVYVSDRERGQVIRLDGSGSGSGGGGGGAGGTGGAGTVVAAGLSFPEGLAALDGTLWCLETGTGRLLRIDPRARRAEVAVEGLALALAPRFAAPHLATNPVGFRPTPFAGLAVHDGTLVVGLSGHGALLRVRP